MNIHTFSLAGQSVSIREVSKLEIPASFNLISVFSINETIYELIINQLGSESCTGIPTHELLIMSYHL